MTWHFIWTDQSHEMWSLIFSAKIIMIKKIAKYHRKQALTFYTILHEISNSDFLKEKNQQKNKQTNKTTTKNKKTNKQKTNNKKQQTNKQKTKQKQKQNKAKKKKKKKKYCRLTQFGNWEQFPTWNKKEPLHHIQTASALTSICICVVWSLSLTRYENTPIQIYRKCHLQNRKFSDKNSDIFHISAQNIDCGTR